MERVSRGFTLLELLVVIGIVVIISGIALASLPILGRQTRVNAAVEEMLRAVRKVRHDSVTITELPAGSGIYPSYGIFFDISTPNTFITYADCVADDNNDAVIDNNDNFTFNPSSTACNGGNGLVKKIMLDQRVHIKEIRSVSSSVITTEAKAYIEYLRPEPSIWLSNANGTVLPIGRIELDITDTGNTYQRTVVFWTTGQVEIIQQPYENEAYSIQ